MPLVAASVPIMREKLGNWLRQQQQQQQNPAVISEGSQGNSSIEVCEGSPCPVNGRNNNTTPRSIDW